MEIVGRLVLMAVIFVAATLASGAGTGGGALYLPGYVVSLGDVHKAVPLSKVTIFGGCLMSVLINIRRRHPKSGAPLINYELAAIMEPFTLLGAIIGVLLNVVMSDFQILACLVLTLSFTSYKTFKKGLAQRAEETRILQQLQQGNQPPPCSSDTEDVTLSSNTCSGSSWGTYGDNRSELQQLLPPTKPRDVGGGGPAGAATDASFSSSPNTRASLEVLPLHGNPPSVECASGGPLKPLSETEDTTLFVSSDGLFGLQETCSVLPVSEKDVEEAFYCGTCKISVLYLAADSVVNVLLLLLAGGPVAVLCGSQQQQACIYLLLSVHVLGTFLFARWLIRRRRRMEQTTGITCSSSSSSRGLEEGGLGWLTPVTAFVYPLLSMLAGVLAGAIGIGGGLVKGPLLLEIGLSPLAAVSTANFMIFFTSSANTLQYAILGRLELLDSICFFLTAFVAGAAGLGFVYQFVKKTHRQSYLTFFLSFVSVVSLASMLGSFVHTHYFLAGKGAKVLTLQDACKQQQQTGTFLLQHF